jgi:nitrile hydratase
MDGIHDMGGMHGFGKVDPDYETVFSREEYKRVYGVNMLSIIQGVYNIDKTRYYMENASPIDYLTTPYWERWLGMIEKLYAELGVIEGKDLPGPVGKVRVSADKLWDGFRNMRVPRPPSLPEPVYRAGQVVTMRRDAPATHTRLPRYIRGCNGRIEKYMGVFRFADAFASDRAEYQHVYSVRFDGEEMWGRDCEENTCVRVEIYESYIDGMVSDEA